MKRITAIVAGIAVAMAGASGAIAQSGTLSHRALVSRGCYTHSCAKRVWVKSHPQHAAFRSAGGAGGTLAAIRQCESTNNYTANTGNGFYGAYQFTISTWQAYGGSGSHPDLASPGEQDAVAARLLAAHGTHSAASWPNCP